MNKARVRIIRRRKREELAQARRRAIDAGKLVVLYYKCELTGIHYREDTL